MQKIIHTSFCPVGLTGGRFINFPAPIFCYYMGQILNVIELIGDSNMKVNSFIFREDSVRRDEVNKRRIREAENLFIRMAEENGMLERETEYCLENGIFELGDYKLFLIWSE